MNYGIKIHTQKLITPDGKKQFYCQKCNNDLFETPAHCSIGSLYFSLQCTKCKQIYSENFLYNNQHLYKLIKKIA